MDTPETIFLDIDLVTAGYLAMKGMPLPERYKRFKPEEIEQMKAKVARYMTPSFNEASDFLQAQRESGGFK